MIFFIANLASSWGWGTNELGCVPNKRNYATCYGRGVGLRGGRACP